MDSNHVEEIIGLFRVIADQIVLHPDMLEVSHRAVGLNVSIEARMPRGDKARLIGKNGVTFRALKTVVGLAGIRKGMNIELKRYNREDYGPNDKYPPIHRDESWQPQTATNFLRLICNMCLRYPDRLRIKEGMDGDCAVITGYVSEKESRGEVMDLSTAINTVARCISLRYGHEIIAGLQPFE
jgi:predicted RNA-binding protein YlqC (UPF0109 family)